MHLCLGWYVPAVDMACNMHRERTIGETDRAIIDEGLFIV